MEANEEARAALPSPPRPVLPKMGDFLQRVFDLGKKSFAPALPALVVLYFYRFGMGLYLALSSGTTSPLGFPDYQAKLAAIAIMFAAYLPILVLIWTPFLPLQDAVLAGRKRTFFDSIKHVLELVWPYGISSFVQGIIVIGPAAAMIGLAALIGIPIQRFSEQFRAVLLLFAMVPAFFWIVLSVFFLSFATPLLILDGRGPMASIRESVALIRRHFGGLFGRVFVFVIVTTFIVIFASFPSAILSMVAAASKQRLIGVEIARAIWDSAVGTALYPFSIAALMTLYRAIVPRAAGVDTSPESAVAAESPRIPLEGETTSTTNPYLFE